MSKAFGFGISDVGNSACSAEGRDESLGFDSLWRFLVAVNKIRVVLDV